nr:apelin receptor B-like [Ciona intestinalis]|eukprot:XP_026690841.1 apelin receptor B-like [Ciona intestinalis]
MYVLSTHVLTYRTWGKAKITVFVMWVVAGITSCMSLYFRESKYSSTTGHFHCRWNFDEHISSHVTWFCVHFLLRFFVGFGLPLGTMVVAYIIIIAYLQRRKSQKKLLRRKQDRVTLTVSTVVVVYLACFLPNQISNLIYMAQGLGILPQSDVPSLAQYNIHLVVTCLSWGHGCVNPFLYAFMREDVRLKLTETVNQIGCLVPIKDRRNVTEQTQQTRGQNSRKQTSRSYRSKESLPKQKETQPKPVTIIKAVHAGSPSNLQKCTKV